MKLNSVKLSLWKILYKRNLNSNSEQVQWTCSLTLVCLTSTQVVTYMLQITITGYKCSYSIGFKVWIWFKLFDTFACLSVVESIDRAGICFSFVLMILNDNYLISNENFDLNVSNWNATFDRFEFRFCEFQLETLFGKVFKSFQQEHNFGQDLVAHNLGVVG